MDVPEERDYVKDMEIDPNALDVECLQQPKLFMYYAMASAEAIHATELLEERVKVLKAKVAMAVRKNPEQYGVSKATEACIADIVAIQFEVQEVENRLIECRKQSVLSGYCVKGANVKKEMLEALLKLHGQSYFAGPSVARDLAVEAGKRLDECGVKRDIHAAMNKKGGTE